jgi:hypothetical protein
MARPDSESCSVFLKENSPVKISSHYRILIWVIISLNDGRTRELNLPIPTSPLMINGIAWLVASTWDGEPFLKCDNHLSAFDECNADQWQYISYWRTLAKLIMICKWSLEESPRGILPGPRLWNLIMNCDLSYGKLPDGSYR